MNDTTVDVNAQNWGWLINLPAGGIASARVTARTSGGGYNQVNWCGIAVRLPAGIDLPDIPYPGEPERMKITPPPVPHRAPTAVGGDLAGTTAAPVVTGLGGTPLDTTTPTTGQILVFDGTSWVPTTPRAQSPLTTKGDIFGYARSTTACPSVPTAGAQADSTNALGVAWATASSGTPARHWCRAYNNANLALNNGTDTFLTFNSERYDTDAFHSTSSNTGR